MLIRHLNSFIPFHPLPTKSAGPFRAFSCYQAPSSASTSTPPALFPLTWAHVAAGVLVPDGRLAQSRGTHFGVAQDASLPAGAARALVQVPRLALHVKLPAGRSAHHDVHAFELAAAGLVCSGGDQRGHGLGLSSAVTVALRSAPRANTRFSR